MQSTNMCFIMCPEERNSAFRAQKGDWMNKKKTELSLELLLLNDLRRTDAIDETLYNMAANKIMAIKKTITVDDNPRVLATA